MPRSTKGFFYFIATLSLSCLIKFTNYKNVKDSTMAFERPNYSSKATVTSESTSKFVDTVFPEALWLCNLRARLEKVRHVCGTLCKINDKVSLLHVSSQKNESSKKGIYLPYDVSCSAIMNMAELDEADSSIPYPRPSFLVKEFSMNGLIKEEFHARYNNTYLGANALQHDWMGQSIEEAIDRIRQNGIMSLEGTYGSSCSSRVLKELELMGVRNLDVLVVGSEKPWIEIICLFLGAKSVTTLEYGEINTNHPKLRTMTPDKFRQAYNIGNLTLFDRIVSHSSIEHSGLGRYGDALNPWGDILTMMRIWCLSKPEAKMYLAVPRGRKDKIQHNLHRIYGIFRWPLLTANWITIHEPINFKNGMQCGGLGHILRKVHK
jgi:Caenorhabditis protein of unknown function, DUF268